MIAKGGINPEVCVQVCIRNGGVHAMIRITSIVVAGFAGECKAMGRIKISRPDHALITNNVVCVRDIRRGQVDDCGLEGSQIIDYLRINVMILLRMRSTSHNLVHQLEDLVADVLKGYCE